MTSPLLQVHDLHVDIGGHQILKGASFELAKGEVVALIGPSGSGKTTLLRTLSLLAPAKSGRIVFEGEEISGHGKGRAEALRRYSRSVGIVFQELFLWPHLTVLENLILPLVKGLGMTETDARTRADQVLSVFALVPFAPRFPSQLSVGQKQRCAIARTLILNPPILLLDEITSSLDPELVSGVYTLIRRLAETDERGLLVVSHDMGFTERVADRVLMMFGGTIEEGRVYLSDGQGQGERIEQGNNNGGCN